MKLLLGQTLGFAADPFATDPLQSISHHSHGGVLIEDGKILAIDNGQKLRTAYPQATIHDYGQHLITAGFIDAHVHYPQTAMINSWGKRLIDWLNDYTFPEENRFGNLPYAETIAERYLDLVLAHGTTSICSFCTSHPESVDALFGAASKRDMRVFAGKTCMDRNAPETLQDTAQSAYDQSAALLKKWHNIGRNHYVITPRFAPTSSPEQLEALGALWQENPDCLMQTHLSEQTEEVAWVKSLYPTARDYLDSYEMFGLLGKGGLYGHSIWLEERERNRIRESEAALIHCPTSNTALGSGLFPLAALKEEGQKIGLATDTGGGSSFSMLRTMAAAYEIAQLKGSVLHPFQLYWLATQGSAQTLLQDHRIGNLHNGMDADLVVLNLASTPAIAQRNDQAKDLAESLFPTIMMGDDRAIKSVWVAGKEML